MSKEDWIVIENNENLPRLTPEIMHQIDGDFLSTTHFYSDKVLIQTRKGDMFVGNLELYKSDYFGDEYNWYSYGTGGRRMAVKSKVIAWQPLPELLEI